MTLQLDRAGSGDYPEKANLDVFLVALADRRDRCREKVVSGFAASWRHRATIELPALNDESE